MALCVFLYVLFEAMDSSDSALQLLTQYPSAGSRVWSGVCTMTECTGGEGILLNL